MTVRRDGNIARLEWKPFRAMNANRMGIERPAEYFRRKRAFAGREWAAGIAL